MSTVDLFMAEGYSKPEARLWSDRIKRFDLEPELVLSRLLRWGWPKQPPYWDRATDKWLRRI